MTNGSNLVGKSIVDGLFKGRFTEGTGTSIGIGGQYDMVKYGGTKRYCFFDDSLGYVDQFGFYYAAPFSERLVSELEADGYKLDVLVPVFELNRRTKADEGKPIYSSLPRKNLVDKHFGYDSAFPITMVAESFGIDAAKRAGLKSDEQNSTQ